jgi:hypothetical protein
LNIPNGTTASLQWCNEQGTQFMPAPAGVTTVNVSENYVPAGTNNGIAAVTINTNATAVEGAYYFRVTFSGTPAVETQVGTFTVGRPKTVTVGAQQGVMVAGVDGSTVSFPVTTTGIDDGKYIILIDNTYGTGVGLSQYYMNITAGKGTLYLKGYSDTQPGTISGLTITVDFTKSAPFSVVVSAASVSIGSQSGELIAGKVSSATFGISTVNVGNGVTGSLLSFYTNANATNPIATPAGITVGASPISNNAANVTVNTTAATPAGVYYFVVTYAGNASNVAILTVTQVTAAVGTQVGMMVESYGGSASFEVTTTGTPNGTYPVSIAGLSGNFTLQNAQIQITGGKGTLMINADEDVLQGVRPNVILTINAVQTPKFTVTVSKQGTADYPFRVRDIWHLQQVGTGGTTNWLYASNAHYRQEANIDLSGWIWYPSLCSGNGSFTGVYDGGGYSIINLKSNINTGGLFDYIGNNGKVRNVALVNVEITATKDIGLYNGIGGIANINTGTIENCYVTGEIENYPDNPAKYPIGGIAGMNADGGSIRNCYTTCNIFGNTYYIGYSEGGMYIGGIAGINAFLKNNDLNLHLLPAGKIEHCYATGTINGYEYCGGIAGPNKSFGMTSEPQGWPDGTINYCVALNKKVTQRYTPPHYVNDDCKRLGRITGFAQIIQVGSSDCRNMSNNWGRSNMSVVYDGSNINCQSNLKGWHGKNVLEPGYHGAQSGSWWKETADGPGFSATYWDCVNNRLPHLKTTTGAAFKQPQTPTVQ